MSDFKIEVLGSGSDGNCYLLTAAGEVLILEAGISFKEILKALKFKTSNVKGCLISHHHGDHTKAFREVLRRGVPVACPGEVISKYKPFSLYNIHIMSRDKIKLGGFTILPFDCNHVNGDGSPCECKGYLIQHKAMGTLLFATDTYYLKQKFSGVNHIFIECNYSEKYLEDNQKDKRTIKSHMSLETLKKTLETWNLEKTKDITLIHLSKDNADSKGFRKEIEELTGIKTYIAQKGHKIS